MSDDRDSEREVTRLMGVLYLGSPDLVRRVSHDELRRMAAEVLATIRRRNEIPAVFREAFDDR